MTEQSSDREKRLRSKAAEAFTYKRPDAAKRPIVDTSRLWEDSPQPADASTIRIGDKNLSR